MKYLQRLSLLVLLSAAIFSCQKEYSIETPTGTTNNPSAQWEFKEAGVQFKGPIDSVAIDTIATYTFLTINGRSTDGTTQFTLQAFGSAIKPGTYKTPFSLFAFIKGTTPLYQTDQAATDSFTIVITKADATGIAGTFSGLAKTGGVSKSIVEGKFSAPLKTTTTPPASTDSGQVVLWSKVGCSGGNNPITVSVGGKTGQITSFTATEPSTCTPAGSFSVKLPAGSYSWVAKCGTDSVGGTLIVTKDGCTKQQVDFTAASSLDDYFPRTPNSNWTTKYDTSVALPGDTTFTVASSKTASFLGNAYNIFYYDDYALSYSDTLYYRKSGNTYYQYFPASSNFLGFDTPQAIEVPFLKTDAAIGSTFTSSAYTGNITIPNVGVTSVTQQVTGTILDKVTSVTINGATYNDVIKVRLSFNATAGTQTSEIYRQEQWFAKGIGLIKFVEYYSAPYTTPTYTQVITRYQVY